MLVATRGDGSVLLERRPDTGVWGGLWCLPEFENAAELRSYTRQSLQNAQDKPRPLERVEHAFTHFDLVITPMLVRCQGEAGVRDGSHNVWYNTRTPARVGLPAPVKTLLEALSSPTMFGDIATG
jgi:A/G-specific adenine glycosylase